MIVQTSEMEQYGSADLRCTKCDMAFFRVVNVPGIVICPRCGDAANTQEIRRAWEDEQRIRQCPPHSNPPEK